MREPNLARMLLAQRRQVPNPTPAEALAEFWSWLEELRHAKRMVVTAAPPLGKPR
jgi:hypothetical protein